MRILLIDNAAGAADAVGRTLKAAGHDVVRCYRRGDSIEECAFLRGAGLCPLHAAPVDAVVDVRQRAADGSVPSSVREVGAVCAVHDGVPLVVVGPADPTLFPWSLAAAICQPDEIADRCAHPAGSLAPRTPGPSASAEATPQRSRW